MNSNFITHLLDHASFDFRGFKMEGPALLVLPALIALIYFSIASLVWVYKDARKRNKHGMVALLFILLTGWPASFIWWFWIRPPIADAKTSLAH